MNAQFVSMGIKSDGRMYSRVTKRCVTIIKYMPEKQSLTLQEIASKIHALNLPDFFLKRFNRQISVRRISDYIRYLRDIEVFINKDNRNSLNFKKRSTDASWAQALSDLAQINLGKMMNKQPEKVFDFLEQIRCSLHKKKRNPTIDILLSEIGIEGGRKKEIFKWSLYMFTDGDSCPFKIRRYPTLHRT